jgi:ribonuclease HI
MFSNQTEIGKIFGIDSHAVSKQLTLLGLKHNNQPTDLALRANLCKKNKVWLWDKEEIIDLFVALGYKKQGTAKKNEKKLRKLDNNSLIAYVDGSDLTYAVVLFNRNNVKTYIAGKEDMGDNNRGELAAVRAVLEILPKNESIVIISDSMYVKRTIDNLYKARTNLDIVGAIKSLIEKKNLLVKVIWVKSHTALHGNIEADAISSWARSLAI